MKISHDQVNAFFKQHYYPDIATRKSLHVVTSICWLLMILAGTIIIGVGTANSQVAVDYCSDSQTFCTYSLQVNSSTVLYFYIKLSNFYQYNRMFIDSYSIKQMHGEIDNNKHCGSYYTYGSLALSQTAGGYRVSSTTDAHPCGQVMQKYKVDSIYLVDNLGGTPTLNNGDLVSSFSKIHFSRLSQYQLSQWVDIQSQQFVNYFSVPFTSTKYELIGKAQVTVGSYKIVMQNNFLTQGKFTKTLIVTEIGLLGMTNNILGFSLFSFGQLMLLFHIYLCIKWTK